MRIIGGKYRGKKLFSPLDESIRPTSDRARESIFNILRSRFEFGELKLLDLFCGSGAFGLEAMSEGFMEVCLADKDVSIALKNAALFESEKPRIKVLKTDATNLPNALKKYDIVFMDAPYDKGLSSRALGALVKGGWLADDALVVVETSRKENLIFEGFELVDERTYGIAKFWFLRKI